jgi:hypothetical protein
MDNNVYPALLSSVFIAVEKCLISSLRPLERKVRSTVDETQIECLPASTFLFRILLSSQYNLENVPEIVELLSLWWIFRSQEVQPRRRLTPQSEKSSEPNCGLPTNHSRASYQAISSPR